MRSNDAVPPDDALRYKATVREMPRSMDYLQDIIDRLKGKPKEWHKRNPDQLLPESLQGWRVTTADFKFWLKQCTYWLAMSFDKRRRPKGFKYTKDEISDYCREGIKGDASGSVLNLWAWDKLIRGLTDAWG